MLTKLERETIVSLIDDTVTMSLTLIKRKIQNSPLTDAEIQDAIDLKNRKK